MAKIPRSKAPDNPLTAKVRAAETAFLATVPKGTLPSPEPLPSRATQRAMAELTVLNVDTATEGGLAALKRLDRNRADKQELNRIAERSRTRKRLPAGVRRVLYVADDQYAVRLPEPGEKANRAAVVLEAPQSSTELVTLELAAKAQALRALFDVDPAELHGAITGRSIMRREVIQAVEAAADVLYDVWIPILVEELVRAVIDSHKTKIPMGDPMWIPTRATTPATTLLNVRRAVKQFGGLVEIPSYVTDNVVRWAAKHLSVGRGGGRTRRLSRSALATLLGDHDALAKAMK